MLNLSHSRRPRRAGEWTESRAVTFIVTLAASRSVTLAAAKAGISRKSAYALKIRNAAFAAAWNAALVAGAKVWRQGPALNSFQGDKLAKVHNPPIERPEGDKASRLTSRNLDAEMRDLFFSAVANRVGDSSPPSLAGTCSLA
jgi:hypothetical protein